MSEKQVIKLLLVDDQPFVVQLMQKLAEKAAIGVPSDFEVEIIGETSPLKAMKIIKEKQPHILITDIVMPELNGFELIKHVRLFYDPHKTKIIVVTALEDKESRIKAFLNGANDYVTKPIDDLEFTLRLKNMLKLVSLELIFQNRVLFLQQALKEATSKLLQKLEEDLSTTLRRFKDEGN